MVNTFEYPIIQRNLSKFKNDKGAIRIAKVIDGLIGKSVKDTEGRSRKVSRDMNYHFDNPNGRIVRIERKLDLLLDHFGIKTNDDGKFIGRYPMRRRRKAKR